MKKSVRYLISLSLILLLGVGVFLLNQQGIIHVHKWFYYSVCDTPIAFKIDRVDAEFNLTKDEFLDAANNATEIWNIALGKKLFVYDPKGSLRLSLSYDQRQGLSTEINTLQQELDAKKNSIDPSVTAYKEKVAAYNQKLQALNDEIASWNSRGGAPADVYDSLLKKQQELKNDGAQLQSLATSLNQSTSDFNQEVGQLNQTVETFNTALQGRPEEGLFDPKNETITVYFHNTQSELVHTLAHEFGHARGLDHILNPQAIMYPKTNDIVTPSADDLQAMQAICAERPMSRMIKENIQFGLLRLRNLFGPKN